MMMTEQKLWELLTKYRVPLHILAHMKKVSALSLFIGNRLRGLGIAVDLILLRQGALLHDFVKLVDFTTLDLKYFHQNYSHEDVVFWTNLMKMYPDQGHCQAGYEILMEEGEPVLANIVKKHCFKALISSEDSPETWEEKIVYYADKRVRHDEIVSVKERLEDGRKRYFPDGDVPANDGIIEQALLKLEEEICAKAGIKPDDIHEKAVEIYFEGSLSLPRVL